MSVEERFETFPQPKSRKLNKLPDNPQKKTSESAVGPGRFPSWLHRKLPQGGGLWKTNQILKEERLHTVCEEAKCPNLLECYSKKTATFLAMGNQCTRACGFCDIDTSKTPPSLDPKEPQRIASSVKKLGLKHAVITMVARDDITDFGASHLADIIKNIREENPETTIEVLTSDFCGNENSIDTVLSQAPNVFNHNIETVRSLTPRVRHKATYDRTLQVLNYAHKQAPNIKIKSGIMVGLGETKEEVFETINDLHQAGCNSITIGQYLQPNRKKLLVKEFITPETFKEYEMFGIQLGIQHMFCGPFVRSSYHAGEFK
jgi:lipoyl synthase